MAGRDARPTVVNISPYLKTPHPLSIINIFGLAYSPRYTTDAVGRRMRRALQIPDITEYQILLHFCHGGTGVPACDWPLDAPSRAVNGGQGRPPHCSEHITLSGTISNFFRPSRAETDISRPDPPAGPVIYQK